MLKPKHCYSNEDVYNYNLFIHKATVLSFALDPNLVTQVKFILRNKETEELNCEKRNRFVFFADNTKSRMFYKDDALSIIDFIDVIRDPRVKDYADLSGQIKYHSSTAANVCHEWLRVSMGQETSAILATDHIPVNPRPDQAERKKLIFNQGLTRLKAIMEEFLRLNEDPAAQPQVPFHFSNDRFTVLPLINKWNGWTVPGSLRLQTITRGGQLVKNHICFSYKGKNVLLYSRDSHIEGSSDLSEVVEGFINGLMTLVNTYQNHHDDVNEFIRAVPVSLSEDRKDFMEYVGGRGIGGENHDGPYRTMIVNINSDAAPVSSKVNFHYHSEFMEDLYNGLRFLVNL